MCMHIFNDINDNTSYPFHSSLCVLLSLLSMPLLITIHAACTQVTGANMLENDHLSLRSRPAAPTRCWFQGQVTCSNNPRHCWQSSTASFCSSVFQDLQNQGILNTFLFLPRGAWFPLYVIWTSNLRPLAAACPALEPSATLHLFTLLGVDTQPTKPSWALATHIQWLRGLASPEGPMSLLAPSSVTRPFMTFAHSPLSFLVTCRNFTDNGEESQGFLRSSAFSHCKRLLS